MVRSAASHGQNLTSAHMTHVILFTEVLVCPQVSSLSCMCRAARRSAVLHFISTANRSCSTSPTLWKHTHSSSYRKKIALTALQNECSIFNKQICRFYTRATRQPQRTKCWAGIIWIRKHWDIYVVISLAKSNAHRFFVLFWSYTCRNRYSKAEGSSCSRSAGSLGMKHTLNRHL